MDGQLFADRPPGEGEGFSAAQMLGLSRAAEAVAICRLSAPDVVLMDLEMPVMDGIEATQAILAEALGTVVLVLTSFSDRRRITGALDAGAVGYLLKDASAEDVLRGIRTAAEGGSPVRRTLRDLPGADTVTARAWGPRGLVCQATATLPGS